MSKTTNIDLLEKACKAGDFEACEILRRARPMAARGMKDTNENGYAEGGLLADSSRTWKMESDYPEFQKGIANRLSKENVPAQEIEEQFMYSPLQTGYAEGGEVDNFMDDTASLLQPEVPLDFEDEMPMGDEMMMEGEEEILDGLTPEDREVLFQAMSDYPELEEILNTISANDSSESFDADVFNTEGSVEGAGTGTSDSIPANLSDGEFVFTAKAVQHIGVDKLRKMMAKAEEDADYGDAEQTMAQLGDTGFAAGGLLTRTESFASGGYTRKTPPISGGIKDLSLGYDGPHFSHGQILKMSESYGKGFMKRVFPIAKGRFGIKGMKHGGPVTDYAHDEGTFTGELTPGIGKETRDRGNPHIGEEEIKGKGNLGTTLFELFGIGEEPKWNDPTSRKIGIA